jgi:hypothetical protein
VNGLAANDPQVDIDDPNLLDNPLVRSRYDILVRFVQGISEQDLRFALSRSSNNYRLLAGVGTSAAVTPVSGSTRTAQGVQLAPQNLVLSELKTVLDGNVIAGGMPREDLAIDIMARVGPGQAASMCPEVEPGIMPRGHANVGKVSAFQDSFLIGDLLRRRLSALRKLTENGWPQSSGIGETAFPKLAERGAAELRAWTGPGHLVLFKQSGSFDVLIHGASEQDFGLPAEYDVPGLALVWGKPWVADCAARQRSSCPENFARDYMQLPTLGSMIVKENNAYLGSDERTYAFSFPDAGATECGSSSPCKFNPAYQLQGTEGDEYLYLILLNDPANAGKGRVLTTFPYYGDIGGASLYSLISTHQRKLANDLFGVMNPKPKVGKPTLSKTPGYCIKDVPRDFFVPLENELTSDNDQFEDSWKHYLYAAKAAALRADELGNKIIDLGLQQDFRREAANEEVARICGEFGAGEDAQIENGVVSAPKENSTLALCLDEPTHDIVFLSEAPPPTVNILTELVGCGQNPPDKVIESSPLCQKFGTDESWLRTPERNHIGSMNLAPYYDKSFDTTSIQGESCDDALTVVQSADGAFQGELLQAQASASDMDREAMASVLNGLRVVVQDVLQDNAGMKWDVYLDNALIMSTTEAEYWPACAGSTGSSCCGSGDCPQDKLARELSKIFGAGANLTGAKKEELLQKVTGTVWLMGAMAGQIPEGLFMLPVPARDNFSANDEEAAVLYGIGDFVDVEGKLVLNTAGGTAGTIPSNDRKILGVASQISNAFATAVEGSDSYRPGWVKNVYANPGNYVHVLARSSARRFPEQPALVDFFTQRGKQLQGVTCWTSSAAATAGMNEIFKLKYPAAPDNAKNPAALCRTPNGMNPLLYYAAPLHSAPTHISDVFWWSDAGEDHDIAAIIHHAASGSYGKHFANYHTNHAFINSQCEHARPTANSTRIKKSCLENRTYPGVSNFFTLTALLPSACSHHDRAQLFVNSRGGDDGYSHPCEAAKELARTLALTCVLNRTYRTHTPGQPLPPLNEPADIIKFENWIEDQALNARTALSRLYLTDVPRRVVGEFRDGKVGTGALKGEHGQLVLQYRQHLSTLASGWIGLEKDFKAIGLAVTNARLGLKGVDLAKDEKLKTLAMTEIQIEAQMLKSAVQAAGSVARAVSPTTAAGQGNPFGAAADVAIAGIDQIYGRKQQAILADLKKLADQQAANQVLQVLNVLQEQVNERFGSIQQTLQGMESAVAGALQTASALKQKQSEAQYQIAKGAGEPYVEIDGKPVAFPVNQVLQRQYDINRRRYEAALKEAKYMAYMARLAIEQRIGIRLEDMHEPVGALPAPHEWAEDVCSFQGVNYEALRHVELPGETFEDKAKEKFFRDPKNWTDPYIGDYVDKLEKFVEFYNIQYPSHEGDDVAVLSVRDDLMGPQGRCFKESRNLLFYSHQLDKRVTDADGVTQGWLVSPCPASAQMCIKAHPGSIITREGDPLGLPGLAATEGFTWLMGALNSEFSSPDPDGGITPVEPTEYQVPPASVYQAVQLENGNYVLSWHDRVWTDDPDQPPPAAMIFNSKMRVMVYGPNWEIVASDIALPHFLPDFSPDAGPPDDSWSPQRSLAFATKQPGTHYVVFGVSNADEWGSALIANVQLEPAAAGGGPTGYEATDISRLRVSGDCVAGSADAFRKAFDYSCDGKACYYDLSQPFVIDTTAVDSGDSKLVGKIAQGNFNFRHLTVGLNVVGTGVTDCSKTPTPSCYGTGYLEYTLAHDAYATPIISHLPEYQTEFNFGAAYINRGKALAAERFITLPVGSADLGLLSQPEIQKQEYRGRPLSGSYRLRIYDVPHLNWAQVEDIQVVLNYRYWSRVDRSSQAK